MRPLSVKARTHFMLVLLLSVLTSSVVVICPLCRGTDCKIILLYYRIFCLEVTGGSSPPMGDHLFMAIGLVGSEDPADSAF